MDFIGLKNKYEYKKVVENNNSAPLKPKVSVCVQTYQHANYIKECLDGILCQETNFEYEILLGEDHSSDNTREICIDYANRYPEKIRLFLHHRENNIKIGGQPTGRFNFLYNLYSAKGKYIALCDGDDYWTDPLKLQKQVDFLEENEEFVVCCHNAKMIDKHHNLIREKVITSLKNDKVYSCLELKKGAWMLTPTTVFRNKIDIINLLNQPRKLLNADMLLFSVLGKFGKGIYLEGIKPAVYRVHEGGIWSSKKNNKTYVQWHRYQLEKVLKELHEDDKEASLFFKKRLTDLHRKLHRNLDQLGTKQVAELNKEYFKRNGFSVYRSKQFLKDNFKLFYRSNKY